MKAKKFVTIITFFCSFTAAICAIVGNDTDICLMYDFSMAIFGSALLGFIMSLVEYFTERRKAMETFFKAAYKVLQQMRTIKYLDLDEPRNLVLECFAEEITNEFYSKIQGQVSGEFWGMITHTKREELISWFEENEPMPFNENDDAEEILIQIYNNRLKSNKKLITDCIERYIEVSKIDFTELSNAYGNLDFLFGNKIVRQSAYDSIYHKLWECRNKILEKVYHFDLQKEGKGNFVVCIRMLYELNDLFFKETKQQTDDFENIDIRQHIFEDISDSIEEFRVKTYFKKSPQYEKKFPVLSKTKRVNNHDVQKENH